MPNRPNPRPAANTDSGPDSRRTNSSLSPPEPSPSAASMPRRLHNTAAAANRMTPNARLGLAEDEVVERGDGTQRPGQRHVRAGDGQEHTQDSERRRPSLRQNGTPQLELASQRDEEKQPDAGRYRHERVVHRRLSPRHLQLRRAQN